MTQLLVVEIIFVNSHLTHFNPVALCLNRQVFTCSNGLRQHWAVRHSQYLPIFM